MLCSLFSSLPQGQLLLLVTDLGFLNEYGHVWHVLRDIDDSGEFLDASFQLSSWNHPPRAESHTTSSSNTATAPVRTEEQPSPAKVEGQSRLE